MNLLEKINSIKDVKLVMVLNKSGNFVENNDITIFKTEEYIDHSFVELIGTSRIDSKYLYKIKDKVEQRKEKLKNIIHGVE